MMANPSPLSDILAGLEEVIEDLGKNPMNGEPVELPYVPLTVDQFGDAGELLYGRNWKTEMAELMEWRDSSRVRAMMRGNRPIPKDVGIRLLRQLHSRAQACLELADEIEAEMKALENVAAE